MILMTTTDLCEERQGNDFMPKNQFKVSQLLDLCVTLLTLFVISCVMFLPSPSSPLCENDTSLV